MQNKIVQAMACELPVVATPAANEGIGAEPDKHILLRHDAAGIAEACAMLLRDAETEVEDSSDGDGGPGDGEPDEAGEGQ